MFQIVFDVAVIGSTVKVIVGTARRRGAADDLARADQPPTTSA